ncbi:hypothetical protein MNBD_GAMMA26-1265 [hydrothermal vent metagenome]|uniref:RelE/StbE replicon stabilization toxin n=1 Tax=hydrothermal vent metagenome TaxID=652676 RepID=A0A3B1C4G7_9ZZZZ
MACGSDYRLRVSESVADLIRGLHPQLKAGVKAALIMVIDDPYCGKPLKDELDGLRSVRVKRFRIIYRLMVAEKEVEIVAIGPRKSIYEETYCIIRRES